MLFAAFAQAVVAALGLAAPAPATAEKDPLAGLSARHKAALVVVSALPKPPRGAGGRARAALEHRRSAPEDALVFVDQEGGEVRAFRSLPPVHAASWYRTKAAARAAGKATALALRREGVNVDLAPVLDLKSGPLGSRHFDRPGWPGVRARARGRQARRLRQALPGLGSTSISTDLRRT